MSGVFSPQRTTDPTDDQGGWEEHAGAAAAARERSLSTTSSQVTTARRQRALSRFNVATTYAKEPARARSLTIAKAKEKRAARGGESGDTSTNGGGGGGDGTSTADEGTSAGGGGGDEGAGDVPEHAHHDLAWYETVHKLHTVSAAFALVSFIFGLVSFTTNYWYTTRLKDVQSNNGLFWECKNDNEDCISIDYERDLYWSTWCEVAGNDIKWAYYTIRGFIFTSIVSSTIAFVLILCSTCCYLNSFRMKLHSFAVLFFTFLPIICWLVAIGRFAKWQDEELYCGESYCWVKKQNTGEIDCEGNYGWSFVMGILSLLLQVIGFGFAVARHCFGEWTLEEAEGEDLRDTIRNVNLEHTIKQAESGNRGAAGSPGGMAMIPLVPNADPNAVNEPVFEPNGTVSSLYASGTAGSPGSAGSASPLGNTIRQAAGAQQYVTDDWVFDPESGLDWSDRLFLYRDPSSHHLYDSNSGMWLDPAVGEWYSGE